MTRHELYHIFADKMQWCACGRPQDSAALVRDVLRLCPLYEHQAEFEELIQPDSAGQIILYILTSADVIEHGVAVDGSWITPLGTSMLEVLETIHTESDWDEVFHNEPPPDDCKICYPEVSRKG